MIKRRHIIIFLCVEQEMAACNSYLFIYFVCVYFRLVHKGTMTLPSCQQLEWLS